MGSLSHDLSNKNGSIPFDADLVTSTQEGARGNDKSASKVRGQNPGNAAVSKSGAQYWLTKNSKGRDRLFKWKRSAAYSFQVQLRGRRISLSTGASEKHAAARIAARIYRELLEGDFDEVLARYRGTGQTVDRIATVGEWISAAQGVAEVSDHTFGCYAGALRKIVGDILQLKRTKKRFGPKQGGARKYREQIDSASLEVLTPGAIQQWRLGYVAQADNPVAKKSRMTSCNSTIRQARSLFGRKILKFVRSKKLPDPVPFSDVEFFERQSTKYRSKIDAKKLLKAARDDLAESDPAAFLAMLLALAAGLRKGEIDSLKWSQIDFARGLVRVEVTEDAALKTGDSEGDVPIDGGTLAVLRGFHAKAEGLFVIEGDGPGDYGPRVWGRKYRAHSAFERLTLWLRKKGVKASKPLHELRKELGAMVATEYGIYAAKEILRHSNIQTTVAHYAELKTRPTVEIGAWLQADDKKPENVVEITDAEGQEEGEMQAKRRNS